MEINLEYILKFIMLSILVLVCIIAFLILSKLFLIEDLLLEFKHNKDVKYVSMFGK